MKRSSLSRRTPLVRKSALAAQGGFSRSKGARSGREITCAREGCERRFYVEPGRIGKRKCCSRECAAAVARVKQAGSRTGAANPNFRHGKRRGEQDRELARAFNLTLKGEDRCRVPGCQTPTDHVQLHHAIPRSLGTRESRLNLLNGLPLCASHHQGWHRRVVIVPREAFRPDEWAYLLTVKLTGREVVAWLDDRYPPAALAALPTCSRGHVWSENRVRNGRGYTCGACKRERVTV